MAEPRVAPYQSCVVCFRGDTATGVALVGEAEWIMAATHKLVGLSLEEAKATFRVVAEHELGCDPGMVPTGVVRIDVRLCRECARKTGVDVGELDSDALPGYRQRDEDRHDDG